MRVILQDLVTNAELAMKSLYDLQTATINASGELSPSNSEGYGHIRRKLKEQWESTVSLLKKCHSFGADVELLRENIASPRKEDIVDILKDMRGCCGKSAMTAAQLAGAHDGIVLIFVQYREGFIHQLRSPRVLVEPSGLLHDTTVPTREPEPVPPKNLRKASFSFSGGIVI